MLDKHKVSSSNLLWPKILSKKFMKKTDKEIIKTCSFLFSEKVSSGVYVDTNFIVDYTLLNGVDLPIVSRMIDRFNDDLRIFNVQKSKLQRSGNLANIRTIEKLDLCIRDVKSRRLKYDISVGIYKPIHR
jgi:hypothetical protein